VPLFRFYLFFSAPQTIPRLYGSIFILFSPSPSVFYNSHRFPVPVPPRSSRSFPFFIRWMSFLFRSAPFPVWCALSAVLTRPPLEGFPPRTTWEFFGSLLSLLFFQSGADWLCPTVRPVTRGLLLTFFSRTSSPGISSLAFVTLYSPTTPTASLRPFSVSLSFNPSGNAPFCKFERVRGSSSSFSQNAHLTSFPPRDLFPTSPLFFFFSHFSLAWSLNFAIPLLSKLFFP